MLVVACIKQVPDTTQVQIDPVTNTLVREGIPFIVNPYDTHALEESLRLKDAYGLRSVALSMGPPNAAATLRKAAAVGVDEAILLSDRCFGGADTLVITSYSIHYTKLYDWLTDFIGLRHQRLWRQPLRA